MKVLFIANIPSPYRVHFFDELSKYCELTVIYELKRSTERSASWQKESENGYTIIHLDAKHVSTDTSFTTKILKYLDASYDIIVITMFGSPTQMLAIEYLRLKGIPYFINIDGGFIFDKENKIKYWLKRHFISSASGYLSTSDKTTEYLIHYGAEKDNIYKYPFSSVAEKDILDGGVLDKNSLKEELCVSCSKIVVSVGQFIYRKGYDVLLHAARHFDKNVAVIIIGGTETDEYKRIVDEYALTNVTFVDFIGPEKLNKYYAIADCFVLPTRLDVWGLVINEAMAQGLPIVTTDMCLAGCEMIIDEENGYIVPIDNPSLLAEKINIILNDDNLRMKMCVNNLEKAREYTIEKMVVQHIDIFEKYHQREKQ